jgi:hypothetical protein
MAAILLSAGIAFELLGIALVGAPDWVPHATELGGAAQQRVRVGVDAGWTWVLRLLGRRRPVTEHVPPGGAIAGGVSPTLRVSVSTAGTTSLEEQVAVLRAELKRAQQRLSELEARVDSLPNDWRRELADMRKAIDQRIERHLTETQERYLGARRLGLVCLLIGVALVSASNLF